MLLIARTTVQCKRDFHSLWETSSSSDSLCWDFGSAVAIWNKPTVSRRCACSSALKPQALHLWSPSSTLRFCGAFLQQMFPECLMVPPTAPSTY